MRVLVTGGREWTDRDIVECVLSGLLVEHTSYHDKLTVIEGGARGADHHAAEWADFTGGVDHQQYPAEWERYGKPAGVIRNQHMLDESKPDVVFAFHNDLENSRGTADMVRRAKRAGVPVYHIRSV